MTESSVSPSGSGVSQGELLRRLVAKGELVSYVALAALWIANYFVLMPLEANMILTTMLVIYIASHRSLRLLQEDEMKGSSQEKAVISHDDAYMLPIIASISLFTFYIANKETLNFFLSIYFLFGGTMSLMSLFYPIVEVFSNTKKIYVSILHISYIQYPVHNSYFAVFGSIS
jgi:hypothetical protein